MIPLEDEVIHALEVLSLKDRDVNSLTIFCNPNKCRGGDKEVRELVKIILNDLKNLNELASKKIKINGKNVEVFTLKIAKNASKKAN